MKSILKKYIKILFYPISRLYFFIKPINVIVDTPEETLDKLLDSTKSLIRFGDGEIAIIQGKSLSFQSFTPEIQIQLKSILLSNDENILIGVPDIFSEFNKFQRTSKIFWNFELFKNRNIFRLLENKVYANTHVSRPYMIYKNKTNKISFFYKIQKLWDGKDIIIIEGENSRNGVGNDLYSNTKSIKRIIGPSKNAFTKIEIIKKFVINNINKKNIIFISLGPAAKILAYDLIQEGYRVIDIGHLDSEYEWCKMGVQKKVKLKNKHFAECNDSNISECEDKEYQKQIIFKYSDIN